MHTPIYICAPIARGEKYKKKFALDPLEENMASDIDASVYLIFHETTMN